MKLYFIAGEASGDYIGSRIIKYLKQNKSIKGYKIYGVGGNQMIKEGLSSSLFPIEKISLMGLFEILKHVWEIRSLIKQTIAHILEVKPQILITIDSPGFNFRVVEAIKKLAPDITRIHIVAPSVWAYKPERAIKVAWLYNRLLTLLPFEPPLFEKYGLRSDYIGHPILEQNYYKPISQKILDFQMIDKEPIITITPGSRENEIKMHMQIFEEGIMLSKFSNAKCLIVCTSEDHEKLVNRLLRGSRMRYITTKDKISAFKVADLVLAKSGTNNLEIASCGKPMIVNYKLNTFTWWYLKRLLNIKYACLINIIANKEIIPELIQDNFNKIKVAELLNKFWNNKELAKTQVKQAQQILKKIGFKEKLLPSQKAAMIISSYIKN